MFFSESVQKKIFFTSHERSFIYIYMYIYICIYIGEFFYVTEKQYEFWIPHTQIGLMVFFKLLSSKNRRRSKTRTVFRWHKKKFSYIYNYMVIYIFIYTYTYIYIYIYIYIWSEKVMWSVLFKIFRNFFWRVGARVRAQIFF